MRLSKLMRGMTTLSEETISHQDTILFTNLSGIFNKLVGRPVSLKILKETAIEKLTFDRTGISVELQWNPADIINAHMVPPMMDPNHTLFRTDIKKYLSDIDTVKLNHALKKKMLDGTVDRTRAKVGGDYSKVAIPMCLYGGLFKRKLLTGAEIAAVYLHELGHAFTFFECLTDSMTRNYQMVAAIAEFSRAKNPTDRVFVIREIDTKLNLKLTDVEGLAGKNDDVVHTVIVTEMIKKQYSESGTALYDIRTWESLSDQFASRMGASKDLASALNIIYKESGSSTYWSTPTFMMVEVLKIVGVLFLFFLTFKFKSISGFIGIVGALLVNPYIDTYDTPQKRLARIKQDLISRLKTTDLSINEQKQLLEDAKFIEKTMSDMNDRETFWQKVWYYVNPMTRQQVDRMTYYKDLEALANNNLYLTAATLRTM